MSLAKAAIRNLFSRELNRGMIGFSIESPEIPVLREEIAAYQDATRESILSMERTGLAPPLFTSKLFYPWIMSILSNTRLRVNFLKMVHGDQEIIWKRPLALGDAVQITARVKDIRETMAGEILEIESRLTRKGDCVIEAVSGFVVRRHRAPMKISARNEKIPDFILPVRTEKGQELQYAAASGDRTFIHTNRFFARMAGFPGRIMHGLCLMAMSCSKLAGFAADGNPERLLGMKLRFSRPVLPGEVLSLYGYLTESPGILKFEVKNRLSQTVIRDGRFAFTP